jgi:hypothetical protein
VSLREDAARAQIEGSMPAAAVSVERVYSTRIGAGLVIRQQPRARSPFPIGTQVRLVVSKGSPYAPVPAVAGRPAEAAKASLVRQGFTSRYAYAPSWTVRKGSVVGLQPRVGTRLRRPRRSRSSSRAGTRTPSSLTSAVPTSPRRSSSSLPSTSATGSCGVSPRDRRGRCSTRFPLPE